ncbi:EamA family transporter RarD [Streptococcus ovuberis]|uniref:EamA family transporter RarD n=1 Tax=Streptococcus ovuberis TaxID=1936207 RepID=A0A7X6S154_9STRE|nr:EamA family transporter RarD [Streptococcus ovuberis]NKZ20432.1 EamA family transporter RarD [Streptococcus ovuberis]
MNQTRKGLLLVLICYLLWGILSLYWKALGRIDSFTVFSYRIVFTVLTMLLYMVLAGKQRDYRKQWQGLRQDKNGLRRMVLASVTIAINWGVYIQAVSHGQAAQASLGYYIMPLVSICLSVIVLKEKISYYGKIAVLLASCGVALLLFQSRQLPMVALTLAISFGFYGLLKKEIEVSSDFAMLFEASCVLIFSLPYLLIKGDVFWSHSPLEMALIALSGAVTAIPLLLFAEGIKRAPLNLVGFIQYVNPTIQLLLAIGLYGEVVNAKEWPAFLLIWGAIGVFVLGQLKELKSAKMDRQSIEIGRK